MCRTPSLRLLAPLLLLTAPAWAADQAAPEPGRPRLTLKHAPQIEAAPLQSPRFTLTARFAREESAGELREGGGFALIGRFAKTGASCDFSAIFSNGFEGN